MAMEEEEEDYGLMGREENEERVGGE